MRLPVMMCIALSLTALARPAFADALLKRALEPASADLQRVWTLQRTGLDYDSSGRLKSRTVAQFDGTKPSGQRWTLLTINGVAPSKSDRAEFDAVYKSNALAPCYSLVQAIVPLDAAKIDETESQARYHLDAMPAGTTMVKGIDLSKYTQADIIVDKAGPTPFVREMRIYAPKEFKPIIGGKVTFLERKFRFAMGEDGIPVLREHRMTAKASVMFKRIVINSTAAFSHQETVTHLAATSLDRSHSR